MEDSKSDCTVSGALSLILTFSQITGLAPVSFIGKRKGRWIIKLSSNLQIYSFMLITILNVMTFIACTWDFLSEEEDSVRLGSPIFNITVTADILIVILVSSIGVYGSTARLRNIMKYLNKMETLDRILKDLHESKSFEKRKCAFIILIIILWVVICVIDFWFLLHDAIYENKNWKIAALYSAFCCQFVIIVILELQFVFTIILISSYLIYSNDSLKQLLENINYQTKVNSKSITTFSSKSVNNFIDSLSLHGIDETETDVIRYPSSISAYETIQNAGLICDFIDDVIKNFVKSNGVIMTLLLLFIFLHLVITLFYIIILIWNSQEISWFMLYQVCWFCLHINNLIMIMEPCHQTHEEMNRKQLLLSELLRLIPHSDPIYSELDMLSRQLHLNETRYSPLGMYVFGRPLIAKILGNILTYLVIILRFHK